MGMLERAPVCLEQGGRRILAKTPPQFRSRRALHSAFWTHGAGEINLPSWWISLLQRPPPETSSSSQSIVDTAKKCLSAGLADGGFLEFLYPAKTLTLIHKLAVRDGAYRTSRPKLSRPSSSRPYSSEASEEQFEIDPYPSLVTESDRHHAESSLSSIRQQSKATSQKLAVSQKEVSRDRTDPAILKVRRQQVIEMWKSITGSFEGRIQDAEADEESLKRLIQLQRTALFEHSQHLSLLLEAQGSRVGIKHFSTRLKSYYHHKRHTKAMRVYEEALDQYQDHEATPALMRIALDFEDWNFARRGYLLYQRSLQDESYFWKEVYHTDPTTLMEKVFRMSVYAIQRLEKPIKKSDGEGTIEGLREFAIKLIETSLTSENTKNIAAIPPRLSELVFDSLMRLVGSTAMTYDQYRSILRRFLEYTPVSKAESAEYGFRAIRVYHQMRQDSKIYPEQELVEDVLRKACRMHHSTTRKIYDDLRSLYGIPDSALIQTVLEEMEYQADVKSFYSIFDDARNENLIHWDSHVMLQLLRMFTNRRQASQARTVFDSIERLTGEKPNASHWNALIAAFAGVEDIANARKYLQSMIELGLVTDAVTYEPLFKYYGRRGDVAALDALCQTLEESNLGLQNFVFESYVQAHIENQQLEEAEATLAKTLKLDFPGSRSRMWGQLARAYARMRMKDQLEMLRLKMREFGISEGDEVCQALMISHNWDRKPFEGLKIIRRVLPDMDIPATAYHYALVMSGLINIGKPHFVPEIEQNMRDRGIVPDFSVKTMKIRAAGRHDMKMHGENWGVKYEKRVLRRGEEELSAVLESSDRMDMAVAHGHSIMGIRHANYDDAYAGNYFTALLPLYSTSGAWKRAAVLYDRYIARSRNLASGNPPDPPVKLIGWLMSAFRHSQEFSEVERGWKLAVEKAAELVAREGADRSAPGWVLPARRYHLALPMTQYMLSLFDTQQLRAVEALVGDVHRMGFELDSGNWNAYVQGHAAIGQAQLAFVTAERELMPGWRGWPDRSESPPRRIIGRIDWLQPREHETLRRMPSYKTMVLLTRAYMRLQEQWMIEGRRKAGLEELIRVAPRTVEEVTLLPRMNDRFQRAYLLNL